MSGHHLPLATSSWDQDEFAAIQNVIESGFFTMGDRTKKFEKEFAEWVGRKHAIMVNSGSSANLLAVASIKYGKFGKQVEKPEVLVPAVSWITTYSPLAQLGFNIRLVDVDPGNFNLDVNQLNLAINENTVGIFGVNLLGNSLDWQKIENLASKNDLWVLEDNCESMGSKLNHKLTGTNGLASTFSFFYSHHICTMEGGMVVCDDDNLATILKSLRAHGWSREESHNDYFLNEKRGNQWEENFRFYLPGFNLRPTEINAAIGSEQLKKIQDILVERRENAKFLKSLLSNLNTHWKLQEEVGESSWFTFGFVYGDTSNEGKVRAKLINLFSEQGIQSRPIVAGNIQAHPVAKSLSILNQNPLPNADHLHQNGFMIGNHHFKVESALEKVVELILESEKIS